MTAHDYNVVLRRRLDLPHLNTKDFKTLLYCSKLVIIQEENIQVLDINNDNGSANDIRFEMESIVIEAALQQHLLWIVLQTGGLVLIDLIKMVMTKVQITNYVSYKFKKIIPGYKFNLISESEENLLIPYTVDEVVKMMDIETGETLQMSLEKNNFGHLKNTKIKSEESTINGLHFFIDKQNGSLFYECLVTGIQEEIISAGTKFKYVLVWGDYLALADSSNIWIVDVCTSAIILELKAEDLIQRPIATYNNALFYLSIHHNDVSVKCFQNSSDMSSEPRCTDMNGTSRQQQSQDFLKTQLKTLVDDFITQSPTPNSDEVAMKIKPFIQTIDDKIFLIKMLRKLCENKIMSKTFSYFLQKKIKDNDDKKTIFEVNDFNFKLDILEYIQFKGINSYDNFNLFENDFKELCIEFISNSDFDLASMCWLKYAEIRDPLSALEVANILNAIPHNTKMGLMIIWLRNFAPSLLDENPFYIDLFVRWITDRVFKLEKSAYWPKIGLKFIDDIKTVLESSLKTITIIPISMDDLDLLRDQIVYIMELKEKYRVNMFLNELSTKNPTEVALIMLHRCYTEDLGNFLKDYIPAFTARHNLDLDDIMTTYIENEASSGGGNIEDTRFSILLDAFRMPNSKLDCLLNVLRVLEVPWSKTIQEIAIKSAAMANNDFTLNDNEKNSAREIAEELNYANLKVVLKKYNFSLVCTDYNMVLQKVVNAPVVSLHDLKIVMSVMTGDKNYGSILYIDRCLRDCDTKGALNYFSSLPSRDSKIILKALITKYEHKLDCEEKKSDIERCYLDFFKGSNKLDISQLNMFENMYHLKNSHDTRMSLNLMCREEPLLSEHNIDSERSRYVTRLMNVRLTQNSAILDLLYRTSSSSEVRKIIQSLIKSLIPDINPEKVYKELSIFKDEKNVPLLIECCKVLVQLIVDCREEHLNDLTKVLYLLNALVNTSFVVRNLTVVWKFNYVFLPMSSVSTINDLVNFLSGITPDDDNEFLSNLCNKNDLLPLRVFSDFTLKHLIKNQPFDEVLNEFKQRTLKRIIAKIIMSHEIDELLLTNLLLLLDSETDGEDRSMWIIDLLKGQHESMTPNIVAYLTSPFTRRSLSLNEELARNAISYAPQYLLKSKYNINLAEGAIPDITEETWDVKIILFYVLIQNPDITLERLIDICRTLNVSVNDGLSLQLVAFLTSWELKYETYTDELGCRQINIEHNESMLLSKCLILWESVKDKDFVKDILNDLWKNGEVSLHGRLISINPYNYELYLCIYQLIFAASTDSQRVKEYFLLNFLKDYKRKSNPQQYEFEQFSAKGMFPEIGYFRLPFHLFMRDDMWSNLKSEITLETYELWLPAVGLLSLDGDIQTARDMICSNALKQTMKSKKPGEQTETESKETEPWRLSTREEPLLRAAHRCVRHIANMEWAGACLFYVLQGCARGADQVAAAQLCYQFSQRWDTFQPGNRAVRKMERLHSTLSTRHVLHKINWASEELVHLTVEPTQLIRTMYLHPKLVEKMARYDVNRAANEIADKNGINISSIRIQILENILENNNSDGHKKNIGLTNNELITAKYILKATCPKMGAIYLSRIAFDDDTDFKKSKKLRALQCLMSIVDSDTAIKVTNRDRPSLWNSILEIYYVINLEIIDMPWIVETFIQDKNRALEQVCGAIGSNVNGIKLVAELTRRYGTIENISNVMPAMLKANLHEDAIPLLLKIYYPPDEIIRAVWRAVLLRPFECADYPITDRQKTNCLRALNLLPFCPAINDDDLKEIWKHCVRCKSYGIACLMLPYMMPETRNSLAELRRIDKRNLIASLKNLQSETFLVSGAMSVLEGMTTKSYR